MVNSHNADGIGAESAKRFTEAWMTSTRQFTRGVSQLYTGMMAANAAALSTDESRTTGPSEDGYGDEDVSGDEHDFPGEPAGEELAYTTDEWSYERTTGSPEGVSIGDRVSFTKRISDDDVRQFAQLSGDTNRLHLDDEFAEDTRFGRRIAHGTLVSGLISSALARLPGLTVYLSQELSFKGPAEIGDTLTAVVEVLEDLGGGRYRLSTEVLDADEVIVDGEAVVLIDSLPGDEQATEE